MSYSSYFKDKRIWVTGASSGIGEQLVYQLNLAGAHLIISARRGDELERVKSKCTYPQNVSIELLDLGSEASVINAFNRVNSQYGSIDMLFNNGGISQRSAAMETSSEVERTLFEVNFFSNVLLSKLVCAEMIKRKSGHLVITSTLLGKWGFYLRSSYSASKHALHGYYDSLRMEVEKDGVNITLVTPGFIATEISKHAFDGSGNQSGGMDENQARGLDAMECASRILAGVAAGKAEFGVGGKEINGLWVKRFFPKMFERILRRKSAK